MPRRTLHLLAFLLLVVTALRAQDEPAPPHRPTDADPAPGERIELPLARLFVPAGFELPPDGAVPLCVHFQGAPAIAEADFVRSGRGGVLIASTITGLSSAFATPYRDPAAFAALLAAGERALAARAGRDAAPVRFAPVALTFWSAGYGAVREILREPALFARIDALVAADSIYADVVAPDVRAPRIEQMVDFVRFAQAAARGEKTFVIAHGGYRTEYASTAETAALLCAGVAVVPAPSAWRTERGLAAATEAHAGNFHCYAFAGDTPQLHVDCFRLVPELVQRHVAPTPAPAAPQRVRVVCWNIHHGRGLDGAVDVARLAAELQALAPDLVCLQEVDVGVERSGRVDIPAELARRLGMHAAFGKNRDWQGGDYGNAILSRWPIAEQHNHHYRMLRQGEQRGLLVVAVDTGAPGGAPFALGCTHLEANRADDERRTQVPEILAAVRDGGLALVAGDFNDFPDRAVHALLTAELDDAWQQVHARDRGDDEGGGDGDTFPSSAPDRRIDWVLLRRDSGFRAAAARVVRTTASDHCALVVDLERTAANSR